MPLNRYARRRRRIGVLLLVTTIVGLMVAAIWVRSEAREESAYLDLARSVADEELAAGTSLADLLAGLGGLERPEALDRIAALQVTTTAATTSLAGATVPASLGEVHGYLTVAAGSWKEGLDTLEEGVLSILDEAENPTGQALIAAAMATMRVGDRAYLGFTEALGRLEAGTVTRDYPAVAFVEGGAGTLYDPAMLATRLRAFAALSERHDIAVTATVQPVPVGQRNEIPVVPLSEDFVVNAVVSNVGNLPEADLEVRLELATIGSGLAAQVFDRSVGSLEPGTSSTISYADLPVEPGVIYEVVVTVRVADDADPANDRWSFVFLRNEES